MVMRAAIKGNVECIQWLIDAGADLNIQNEVNIVSSIFKHCLSYFCLIYQLTFYLSCFLFVSQSGETALMWAAYNNHPDAVHTLVQAGANVNLKDQVINCI